MAKLHTFEPMLADLQTAGFDLSRNTEGGYRVRCSQCEASVINGIACHEAGCPNQTFECKGCNARVSRRGAYCEDCQ